MRHALKNSDAATTALDELSAAEASAFRDRELYLLRRRLSGVQLSLSIFFLLATGAVAVGLVNWVISSWGTWWVALDLGVGSISVIVLIAFTAVGFAGIRKDVPTTESDNVTPT